ncbi:hypothetical protein Patl1_26520 [Pistacia atlantica]|uniref:Uncharacterized protein n=1 Tax=Pistacia atlantica TaxID=434234 RepID=A0ACC1B3W7_9ROSI|nr:hypothetical protein Patl1_26520 [Pistacia atlantica]
MHLCGMNKEDLMRYATNDTTSNSSPPPVPECCLILSMANLNYICVFKRYSSMFKSYGIDFCNPSLIFAQCNLPISIHC